jgi:hypothetical protein
MTGHRFEWLRHATLAFAVTALVLLAGTQARAEDATTGTKLKAKTQALPAAVRATLKERFPGAKIRKWSKEKEGDIVAYDIEFKQKGRKLEADIAEDGKILNWEKTIPLEDLPEAARTAVEKKHPGAKVKEVMECIEVKDGKDVLEGYEVVIQKTIEMTVAADGKVLEEDPGAATHGGPANKE